MVRAGEVVALMGRNGAGKSTLLSALVGPEQPAAAGSRRRRRPATLTPADLLRHVGPGAAGPGDLLYADTVDGECARPTTTPASRRGTTCGAARPARRPTSPPTAHPRDLSEGQRLTLALAVILAAAPPLLLLDEPTRGLDYRAKQRLVEILRELAADGHGVLLATHDVELVAEVATACMVMAEGEIVADGPTAEAVVASPAFAPQVAKVLAPQRWLTVADVAAALASRVPRSPR